MSIFKVGNFIRHQADENLEFKVLVVKHIEDDDGNDTEEISYLELVSVHTGEKFEISTDSFDIDAFDEQVEKEPEKIETNSWNLTKKRIAKCHELASKWLAEHELKTSVVDKENGVYYFAFRKPKCGYYWFDVIAYPTGFTVHGDMGTYTWRNSIGWSKGSIHSIDYFAEKLVSECEAYEWCSDTATAYVWEEFFQRAHDRIFDSRKDETEDIKELADTRDDLISIVDDGQHSFSHHLYHDTNWTDGCDFPDNTMFRWSFLACREALMKAFEILDKQGITL
jgi:hypothetical protein